MFMALKGTGRYPADKAIVASLWDWETGYWYIAEDAPNLPCGRLPSGRSGLSACCPDLNRGMCRWSTSPTADPGGPADPGLHASERRTHQADQGCSPGSMTDQTDGRGHVRPPGGIAEQGGRMSVCHYGDCRRR